MKISSRIGQNKPHPLYVPKDLIAGGFIGDVDILANAATATIVKPGASLGEVQKSLEIILEDVKLRRKLENEK